MQVRQLINHPCVLIARQLHQAQALASFIHAKGGLAIIFPTIDIIPVDITPYKQIIAGITDKDYCIFVSANAVSNMQQQLAGTVIAIGPGTATALHKNGQAVDLIPITFSSEGLLKLPPLQKLSKQQRIFIFCGMHSKPLLANTLTKRGGRVLQIESYRRSCSQPSPAMLAEVQNNKPNIIVCMSQQSLNNLHQLIIKHHLKHLLNAQLIVIHSEMTKFAKQLGFIKPAISCDTAYDDAITKALDPFF